VSDQVKSPRNDPGVTGPVPVHSGDRKTPSIDAPYGALNSPKATPQTTVEAVMFAVRQRGLAALEEAANVERLHRCDGAARAQINQRIAQLLEQKGSSR
jgi:hypothetical protein